MTDVRLRTTAIQRSLVTFRDGNGIKVAQQIVHVFQNRLLAFRVAAQQCVTDGNQLVTASLIKSLANMEFILAPGQAVDPT